MTATIAPVSRSTACSALWARCVRPSFIFVTFASGSDGFVQSLFDVFFFRFRSSRAKSSRVGVSMPEAFASPRQKRLIAFRRVAPHDAAHRGVRFERGRVDRDRFPREQPGFDEALLHPGEDRAVRLQVDQAPRPRNRRMIRRRLLHARSRRKLRIASESVARQAIPRSESMPSK